MGDTFRTFRPQNATVKKYIDYYYLDIKTNNIVNEFECFPHFNNTISIYKSHIQPIDGKILFDKFAKPFQIFTPVREKVLRITQEGSVCRVVLVFAPLGIQQFYRNLNFGDFITDFAFLEKSELEAIFATPKTEILVTLLDEFLEKRFQRFRSVVLEQSIDFVFHNWEYFSVEKLSDFVGVSRQHLNRLFQLHLGVSTKTFYRIVMFRQTVNKKLFENDNDDSFTKLAYEFNFSDQSHLNKAYKSFTGNTPKSFFEKGTVLGEADTFWHLNS